MTHRTNGPQPELDRGTSQPYKSISNSSNHREDLGSEIEFDGFDVANVNETDFEFDNRTEQNHERSVMHSKHRQSDNSFQRLNHAQQPVKTKGLPSGPDTSQITSPGLSDVGRQLSSSSDGLTDQKPHPIDREPQKARGRHSRTSKTSVPPGIRKLPSPPTTLEQAQMEWDLVETVQPGAGGNAIRTVSLTFKEAVQHFQKASYLEQHMSHIKPTIRRQGCAAITHALFGPPKMDSNLHLERNLIFALSLCMFLNEEPVHVTMLQTIYKKLTGTKLDCPRYGNHWDLIGFQGLDPATDLRGCGLLGLLNLLYLVTSEQSHALAVKMYKLSQHETQNFPFCVMSINVTRIALQALREGKLNKNCNSRRQVVSTFSEFYVAVFFHVYQVWKLQHKTISDSGFVLKEAEKCAMTKTKEVIKQLEQHLKDRKNLIIPEDENTSPKNRQVPLMEKFSGVCDLELNEEEEVHLV